MQILATATIHGRCATLRMRESAAFRSLFQVVTSLRKPAVYHTNLDST